MADEPTPSGPSSASEKGGAADQESNTVSAMPAVSSRPQEARRVCKLEGCARRAWVDVKTGEEKEYCGRTHAALALEQEGKGEYRCSVLSIWICLDERSSRLTQHALPRPSETAEPHVCFPWLQPAHFLRRRHQARA